MAASNAEEKSITGTVVRVFKERVGDFTQVSFLLNNKENYIVSSEIAPLAVYMAEGDIVEVTYLNTGELFLPVKEVAIRGIE